MTENGCGTRVEHHVHAAASQLFEPLVRDGGADEGLAGEVFQAEADELVVRRNDDVGAPGGLTSQGVAEAGARCRDLRLHHAGQQVHGPQGGGRGQSEQWVGGDPRREIEAQEWVGEIDVVGVLPEQARGSFVVQPAQHDGASVGEVAGQLRLHVPDRPLLQDISQLVAVADRYVGRGPLDLLDGVELPVVQPHRTGLADASDRDGVRLGSPGANEVLRRGDVAGGPDSDQPELPIQERDGLVVVALGPGEADIDDEEWWGSRHFRSSPSSRSRGGSA